MAWRRKPPTCWASCAIATESRSVASSTSGCGPGVGTCTLAQRFESAKILAIDGSAAMLERLTARARRIGVAPRVETRHVELPARLIAIGRADVVWASLVLHHLGDETETLRHLRGLLEPGGLLAVVEPSSPMRAVPPDVDLGRPGIWDRLDTAWTAWFSDTFPELPKHPSSGNGSAILQDYGFELVVDQMLTLSVDPPLGAQARRFAHNYLLGLQAQLATHADVADLEALDVLTDENAEQSIIRRHDAQIHASRRLYVARAVSDCM